jgi:general secretion pathway protein D
MAARFARKQLALALGAAFLATSCSMMPPSLRKEESAAPVAAAPPEQPTSKPAAAPEAAARADSSPSKLVYGTGHFVNPKPLKPGAPVGPEEASLNFEALDIREVAKVILGDYLKQSYTVHPGVQGTVTFRTVRPISRKDLLPTLEMLLRQNNAAVVIEEGVYKILPIAQVRGSISPQLGDFSQPMPAGFSINVVPLLYVSAREMAKILEPFAADNTIRFDETRNLVILAGNQREMRHLFDTIELFDVDWLSAYSMALFPIKSVEVKSLVADIDKVFGPAGQSPLAGIVRVIPIERMNALLVVTTQPRYLEMAKEWLDKIDQVGATAGGARFYVYQVRNAKAENLAQLVGDIFSRRGGGGPSAPTLAPGSRPTELRSTTPFGTMGSSSLTTTTTPPAPAATASPPSAISLQIPGTSPAGQVPNEVRVIADKDTNSLLILATPTDYDVIESALRKLDVVPRQVLVEVMLAEVLLTDELRLGIEWFINTRNNTTGRLNVGGLPATPTAPVPITSSSIFQLVNFTSSALTDVRAVLNALGQDGRAQVLASPHVMVLDNQKAQIKVGDKVSVQTASQTGVTSGTGVVNSFTYLETGILLAVTPRINSGGMVTLDVSQEVSNADFSGANAINPNPVVNSRSAQTTVVVGSGESIVLAGLIRETTSRSSTGIPLLSKIPVLGAAFGAQGYKRDRTELVLVITPRIISDTSQAREASDELRRKLPALQYLIPRHDKNPPKSEASPPPSPPPAPPQEAPKQP